MTQEKVDDMEHEHDRFRSMLVAMHPGQAKSLLDILDNPDDEPLTELTEQDYENYERLSHEEVQDALSQMLKFGAAFQ